MKLQLYNEILKFCLNTMQTTCNVKEDIFKSSLDNVSEFDTQVVKWITEIILPAIVEKSFKDTSEGHIGDICITIKYLNDYIYIGTPTERNPFHIVLDSDEISEKGLSTTWLDKIMDKIISIFFELQSDGNRIIGKAITSYSWEFFCPVNL